MKTYILREAKTVEPQKPRRQQGYPPPRAEVPRPVVAAGPTQFIGLDVHNDSIAVSLAPSDSSEVRRYGIIGGTHDDVLRLSQKLQAAHPGVALKFCYEAGPRGYPLCRFIRAHGCQCLIVSPSKVPRAPGDRVKTDRRDADQLARLLRAGELAGIYVPDAADEAVRDLIRARYQVARQRHRARQQLKMFLLRQNVRYPGTTAWGPAEALRLAANALWHSKTYLGDCFRRWKARLGTPKAITAMAHKLARIIWHLIKYQEPYDPRVWAKAEEKNRQKKIKRLEKNAANLGFQIAPIV